MDSSCGDSAKPHGDALRPSAGGSPPAPPPAALASAGPAARVGDALRDVPRPSLPLAPTASAADFVGAAAAAAAAGAATTTLSAEGRGSSPCAGLAAHETLDGFPPSAFAAHGDASALASAGALGLPAAAARALDSEAPPEDAGDDERFCRSALRQRELALPPSHGGSRHGDALVAGRALVAASFEPSVTAAHPRE
jgi:hypothetical protein